jgi:putative membrane protein
VRRLAGAAVATFRGAAASEAAGEEVSEEEGEVSAAEAAASAAAVPREAGDVKPSELIGAADRERIEQAVRDAERGTSGEIVVVVVSACDEYGSVGWRCGAGLAALVFLALGLFAPLLPFTAYLAAQVAAMGVGHGVARIDGIRRRFVAERRLEENAARRAWSAFAEHGLRRTAERTGILIFVALFEHRVVVLGDEAVDRALDPDESWREIVDLVLEGIRGGRASDGIVAAVRRCGEILAHPLPAADPTKNEIVRGLVLED